MEHLLSVLSGPGAPPSSRYVSSLGVLAVVGGAVAAVDLAAPAPAPAPLPVPPAAAPKRIRKPRPKTKAKDDGGSKDTKTNKAKTNKAKSAAKPVKKAKVRGDRLFSCPILCRPSPSALSRCVPTSPKTRCLCASLTRRRRACRASPF